MDKPDPKEWTVHKLDLTRNGAQRYSAGNWGPRIYFQCEADDTETPALVARLPELCSGAPSRP